jgi:hypothetical protein
MANHPNCSLEFRSKADRSAALSMTPDVRFDLKSFIKALGNTGTEQAPMGVMHHHDELHNISNKFNKIKILSYLRIT